MALGKWQAGARQVRGLAERVAGGLSRGMITVAALDHFPRFDDPPALRGPLLDLCVAEVVKGTLLLARERPSCPNRLTRARPFTAGPLRFEAAPAAVAAPASPDGSTEAP